MMIGQLGSLSLDQLRMLVAVAEEGTFSAAARSLGRAQSAVSQGIAKLEDMHQVEIFDRSLRAPVPTETGRVLIEQARHILAGATRFETIAAHSRAGLEPELAIAIDPLVPSEPLIDALRALRAEFPDLAVNFSTEGLGGALRRLRDGSAMLAVCMLLPLVPEDVLAFPLSRATMVPVAASDHPLARLDRPATAADLAPHVQLVLSDPVETIGPSYGVASARVWRFVDIGRRMDFLRAGLGWCRTPIDLMQADLASGALRQFSIEDDSDQPEGPIIFAAHRRDRVLGPAGRWLLDRLLAGLRLSASSEVQPD